MTAYIDTGLSTWRPCRLKNPRAAGREARAGGVHHPRASSDVESGRLRLILIELCAYRPFPRHRVRASFLPFVKRERIREVRACCPCQSACDPRPPVIHQPVAINMGAWMSWLILLQRTYAHTPSPPPLSLLYSGGWVRSTPIPSAI